MEDDKLEELLGNSALTDLKSAAVSEPWPSKAVLLADGNGVIDSQNLLEPFSLGPYEDVNDALKDKTELDWKYLTEEQRNSLIALSQRTAENERSKREERRATESTSLTAPAASGSRSNGSKNVTLIPIQAKSNGLIAVLCIFHRDGHSCVEEDLATIRPHIKLICSLLAIVLNVAEQKRLAEQSAIFLEMAQNVFSSLDDMTMLVRNITKEAKTLVRAETCSLFLLDKEHGELVAEVFEKNGMNDEYLKEIRLPIDQGIVGQVAATGQMINVRDAYSNPAFYKKVDERTGFHTRNILCFPIKDSAGDVVGVAELCNKIGGPSFTNNDEQIAATFSVYCAISISHIAEEDVLRLSLRPVLPIHSLHSEFKEWNFLPRKIEGSDAQLDACLTMFQDLGFSTRWRISDLERVSLLVAALCHDIDHRGTNNAFQVKSEYHQVLDHIRDIILATDIAQHLLKVAHLRQMINRGYDVEKKSDHYLLLSLMMTCCDLSDQTKDWSSSKSIAANIYTEFFSQGDLEKAMGNNPIEMMDRERACVPKLQLDFLDTVAIPVYQIISEIVDDCLPVYESICIGRKCWGVMEDLLSRGELVRPDHGNLDILRDRGLEQSILQHVHRLDEEQPAPESSPKSSSLS